MTGVRFPNGTTVAARSLDERRTDHPDRDYGLYMDPRWAPNWPATVIEWADYGLPADWHQAADQIRQAFRRARSGQSVEIGCAGGIGRTGTVLACMAVLAGVESQQAVGWVRKHYRRDAVETIEQERWVGWFAGGTVPLPSAGADGELTKPDIHEYLESVGYAADRINGVRRMRGLTNDNYLVETGEEDLVVRIASSNDDRLGIDRFAEWETLRAAEVIGVGPEVVHYTLPAGHMVSRRIDAESFESSPETFRTEATLGRVVEAVSRIHALPRLEHRFDPFERIERTLDEATRNRLRVPGSVDQLRLRLRRIRDRWDESDRETETLCHNDLFAGNLLNAEAVRIVDWEFCGMGNSMFDLATLVVSCGENAPLPQHLQDALIKAYTGAVDRERRARLSDMVFVVRFHAGCWGIAQQLGNRVLPPDAGFTYAEYTDAVLTSLAQAGGASVRRERS